MTLSPAQATLQSYDILLYLFDHLNNLDNGGRAILASCARVCHTWQEPASYVLWRHLASFHPLWNLLNERHYSSDAKWISAYWQYIDPEDFVQDLVARHKDRWQYFLHRASHVREVGVAACSQSELALIHVLTKYNHGRTILPSLAKLSWRHAVPTDTSILLLGSPSLQDLEITVSRLGTESTGGNAFATPQRFGDYNNVDPVFIGLASSATALRRLTIAGRQGPGSAAVSSLFGLCHLRKLYLYNQSFLLGPEHIRAILVNFTELEVLFARVSGFSNAETPARSRSLTEMRLQGSSDTLQTMLSGFLDTPFLKILYLRAVDDVYSPHCFDICSLIASSSFAQSLRGLSVNLLNEPSDIVWSDIAPRSFAQLIRPLFSLTELRDVDMCLVNAIVPCTDADILEIAQSWKHVERLHLAYAPFQPDSRPTLNCLQYFANHCPELLQLSMTKLSIPETINVALERRAVAHPLRSLDLKMTFSSPSEFGDSRLEKMMIAQYIDYLFPNLSLSTPDVSCGSMTARAVKVRLPDIFTWGAVEQQIRLLRNQRNL